MFAHMVWSKEDLETVKYYIYMSRLKKMNDLLQRILLESEEREKMDNLLKRMLISSEERGKLDDLLERMLRENEEYEEKEDKLFLKFIKKNKHRSMNVKDMKRTDAHNKEMGDLFNKIMSGDYEKEEREDELIESSLLAKQDLIDFDDVVRWLTETTPEDLLREQKKAIAKKKVAIHVPVQPVKTHKILGPVDQDFTEYKRDEYVTQTDLREWLYSHNMTAQWLFEWMITDNPPEGFYGKQGVPKKMSFKDLSEWFEEHPELTLDQLSEWYDDDESLKTNPFPRYKKKTKKVKVKISNPENKKG